MFNNNVSKIKDILTPLIATTKLTAVYDYDVRSVNTYPFAKISVAEGENTFYSTGNNHINTNYIISIINQANITSTSESDMRGLVDSIITEFNKIGNINFSGTCVYQKITSITLGRGEGSEPIRMWNINIEVQEEVNN